MTNLARLYRTVAVFLFVAMLFACCMPRLNGQIEPELKLRPGDSINVLVFDTPELSGPTTVGSNGEINVPLVGAVHVAGLTLQNASSLIGDRLIAGGFLKHPDVTITLTEGKTRIVTVLGEVNRPGPIPLVGQKTLLEVLGAAGGPTPLASNDITIMQGGAPSTSRHVTVDWNADLSGQPDTGVTIGDVIQVGRSGVVYVVGQVLKPGGFPISHQSLSFSQAIGLAQGVAWQAKASHCRLVRLTDGKRVVTEVDAIGILKGTKPDIPLRDQDFIYVPNSTSKVLIARGLQAALGVGSQIIVYRNQR